MIAVVGGSLTALIWTIAVFTSSRASRLIGAPSTAAGMSFVGLLATIPLLVMSPLPTAASVPQLPWLFVAGAGNIIGLLASYAAVRRGRISIVAPITSTEGAIAATLALLAGEPATALLLIALSLVVTGVVLTAYGPEGDETAEAGSDARRGGPVFLALAVGAALLFGVSLFAVGHTSGQVPAPWIVPASGRIFGVLVIGLPLVVTRRLRMTRAALPLVIACGLAEVGGLLTVTWGSRDSIAITAVLSSQVGVIAAVVAMFLGERVERHQLAGAVLTGVGVAAVTLIQL